MEICAPKIHLNTIKVLGELKPFIKNRTPQILTLLKAQWYKQLHSEGQNEWNMVTLISSRPSTPSSAAHQFTLQLTELQILHISSFLGTLSRGSVGFQWCHCTHTSSAEKRKIYQQQGLLWLGSSTDYKELSLRQVQDEQHGIVSSPQPLMFKPHSSKQLSVGCPFSAIKPYRLNTEAH